MTWKSLKTGKTWELVFSDEFETEGRSFYPGDDRSSSLSAPPPLPRESRELIASENSKAYWEAVDLHYWSTNNLEWYDPRQLTTANGSLVVSLDNKQSHGLECVLPFFRSTWLSFPFLHDSVEKES